MSQLAHKIEQYLKANSINSVDFESDVILYDDGSGPYIKVWNISGVTKPTNTQLNSYEAAADLKERQDAVRETRRAAYGSIEDQMDMQYKDNINSTTTWKDHVAAVKSANPIPTE